MNTVRTNNWTTGYQDPHGREITYSTSVEATEDGFRVDGHERRGPLAWGRCANTQIVPTLEEALTMEKTLAHRHYDRLAKRAAKGEVHAQDQEEAS